MTTPTPARGTLTALLLAVAFLVSGAAGLVDEVIWTRKLLLVFGSTSFAVGTVLAAFMGGLALGSRVLGRRADRSADPLRLYALLELGIGAYGLASPLLLDGVSAAYAALHGALHPGFALSVALRLLLGGSFVLVPTVLMGGTLPVLARYAAPGTGSTTVRIGLLYAINTAGAVAGALLGGLWLFPWLGANATLRTAGVLNLTAAAIALALRAFTRPVSAATASPAGPATAPAPPTALETAALQAMALSGFASFLYEVTWTRTLNLVIGTTHDALTVMLAAFLVGIAGGSALMARRAARTMDPARLFLGLEWAIGASALLVIPVFGQLPYVLISAHALLGENHARFVAARFALALLAMAVPTFLIGATFPVASRLAVQDGSDVGRRLGRLYFWNTLGCIAGALGGSFFLIPTVGALWTARLAAVVNAVAAMVLAFARGSRHLGWLCLGSTALLVAAVPEWDRYAMTSAPYYFAPAYGLMDRTRMQDVFRIPIIYYREGVDSVVTVREASGARMFQVNGKTEATTGPNQTDILVLLSEVALQLAKDPKDALVIGWGTGTSTGALTQDDALRTIDLVELEQAVLGAADLFREANHDAIHDPKVQIHVDDGRNFVALTDRSYDVIVTDPPDPWITGPSHLFTIEHVRNVKKRLRPGGVLCHWVAMNVLTDECRRSLLRSFGEVFEHVAVWEGNWPPEQAILCSDAPLVFDYARFQERLSRRGVRRDLVRSGLDDPSIFAARCVGEIPRALWEGAPLNADDRPVLELTPRSDFFRPRPSTDAHHWLLKNRGAYRFDTSVPEDRRATFFGALGSNLEARLDPEAALDAFKRAAEADPASAASRAAAARLSLATGRLDDAIRFGDAALALRADDPEAGAALASAWEKKEQPERALAFARRALAAEKRPEPARALREQVERLERAAPR